MSKLLLSLFTKEPRGERMGVIRSGRSLQKSNREPIASISLYKRATVSDSLYFMSELIFCSQKTSNLLEKPKREFLTQVLTQQINSVFNFLKLLMSSFFKFCKKYLIFQKNLVHLL